MYLDTAGVVTAGVGHAIFDSAHALKMPWTGPPADAQVAADFAGITASAKGRPAPQYESLSQCRLSDQAVDSLLLADISAFETQLSLRLPAWMDYPEPVQQALFDMAYNLGIGGLLKFQRMLAACAAGDWELAATQCHRSGIADSRNQAITALFLQAAAG